MLQYANTCILNGCALIEFQQAFWYVSYCLLIYTWTAIDEHSCVAVHYYEEHRL